MTRHVERRRTTSKTLAKLLCERFIETVATGLRLAFYCDDPRAESVSDICLDQPSRHARACCAALRPLCSII
jgi:hypothetical protein